MSSISTMKIAVEGCAHGELNKIYESIAFIEKRENITINLLLCCGDFQSVRDENDMNSMAVPQKYMQMKDFHEYYTGAKTAPLLTVFIGGNHEAASYLWELPYGGWVAENIFYLGYAGVLNYAGLRIAGLSGIYKKHDFFKDHFERPPFNDNTKRSFYHVRNVDVEMLKLLADKTPIDIFMSHDWPRGIYHHGDCDQLLRFKPYFREEIDSNALGSPAGEDLLNTLKPRFWFSGHMHAKFAAMVSHPCGKTTRFLALDKCLPKRNFLQVLDFECTADKSLSYDSEWLTTILQFKTRNKSSVNTTVTNETSDLNVIEFSKANSIPNPQTTDFCARFELINPCLPRHATNPDETDASRRCISLPPARVTDDDDFGEIVKPQANDEEILLSSDDSDENPATSSPKSFSQSSFIETPNVHQTPNKPFVLVRRNQSIYADDNEEDL